MENSWIDYYEILEADINDDVSTIKSKYRNLTKKYHPDLHPEATEEEIKILEEKMMLLNEAYSILTNEERRKEYDSTYEAYKNGTYEDVQNDINDDYSDVNYEDVKENYTEEEAYYAKVMAIKQIIEEELEKVTIIIDSKNKLIMEAHFNIISKDEYFNSLNELISITNEYIYSLREIIEEASNYELLQEIGIINDTIAFLEEMIDKLPKNTIEASFFYKKECYKEASVSKLESLIGIIDDFSIKLDSIYSYIYEGQISEVEYDNIIASTLNEINNTKSELEELINILGILELKENCDEAIDILAKFNKKINTIPKSYEGAKFASKILNLKNKIKDILQKQDQLDVSIEEISNLVTEDNDEYDALYEEELSEFTSGIETMKKVSNEANDISEQVKQSKTDTETFIKDSVKIYEDAEIAHEKANSVYENITISESDIIISELAKSAYAAWNKGESLENFLEARKLLESYKCINSMIEYDEELKELIEILNTRIQTELTKKQDYKKKYKLQKEKNPYRKFSKDEFNKRISWLIKLIQKKKKRIKIYMGTLFIGTAYIFITNQLTKHPVLSVAFISALILISSANIFGILDAKDEIEKLETAKNKKFLK